MPFTGSHAAAVLPFLRTPLPASALVIGSMAPDVPFYLPFPLSWETHSAIAVPTVDLLLGALTWVLWHGLLAPPALAVAPTALRARLMGRVQPGLRVRVSSVPAVAWTVLALLVGAGTHVLWDAFTHPGRWGTDLLPALAGDWGPLPGYRWLQHASGLVGGLVLVAWCARWWRRTPARPAAPRPATRWVWPLLVAVGLVAGLAAALRAPSAGAAAFAGATSAGGTVLVTAVVLATLWRLRAVGSEPSDP